MRKLSVIEISDLARNTITFFNYKNKLGIGNLGSGGISLDDMQHVDLTSPMRIKALILILITEGNARVSLDNVSYELTANSFLFIMPSHIVQITYTSPDLQGKLLLADLAFLEECKPEAINPSLVNYMRLRKNPHIHMEEEEMQALNKYVTLLRKKLSEDKHYFQDEIVHTFFMALLLEMVNIVLGKKDYIVMKKMTRKEEIVNKFLKLLLIHYREEHTITFYADKLFITPQYLSSVLKELTDKTASEWIDEAILAEARVLLKSPKVTVQEVSIQLNFADQSTFGKFFKKHAGMSPSQFKKEG
ncbi:helix-turn-helix domain-containing protein [Parabacteroides sp. OttesenSCG-928-G06]|nr:helix-turn-helix domain-containing protein [Parabacteroides sp. OttesenSCG-928-K15]MDL2282235.1 helix-turn-helix domain-containing protein [Parabacteroides sp. OttesenSCG-928-G06]